MGVKAKFLATMLAGLLAASAAWGQSTSDLGAEATPSLLAAVRTLEPMDFCGEPVPLISEDSAVQEDVRERLEKEMLLILWDRPQVILWLKRAARYFPIIETELARRGLPDDLKYVAVVESALRPHIRSPKSALGYWQFLEATGKKYGLRIDRQIDQRCNIYAATRAAADYFTFLHSEFDSWSLAVAAYNMGEAGLKTALLTQEASDYYQLYLPLETQRYLFRILAAKRIMTAPQRYGFPFGPADGYAPVKTEALNLTVKERTPLRLIAQSAGIHFKYLKDLNPEIRGVALEAGAYTLRLPPQGIAGFHQRLKINRAAWQATQGAQVYVVREGDNLSLIAKRFEVPLPALLLWNRLRPDQPIHPGDQLILYPPKPSKGS
ncbi:MAG: transglycosylase SLT domain-containing protein [Desulfobacterales bacterium]